MNQKTLYTLKRFEDVAKAHILVETKDGKSYVCQFEESGHRMEKSSQPMDASKMRTILAKTANTGAEICGICVGGLYSM